MILVPILERNCGMSTSNSQWRDIFANHTPGLDYSTFANGYATKNQHRFTKPNIVFDNNIPAITCLVIRESIPFIKIMKSCYYPNVLS